MLKNKIFFEGLPKAGKTTLIQQLVEQFSIRAVHEWELPFDERTGSLDESTYVENDIQKLKIVSSCNAPMLIDRAPLSTLIILISMYNINTKKIFELAKLLYDDAYIIENYRYIHIRGSHEKESHGSTIWSDSVIAPRIAQNYDKVFTLIGERCEVLTMHADWESQVKLQKAINFI